MGITWNEQAKDRLFDALLATVGNVNNSELARLYGGEATVSAIENHLRQPKKRAAALKAEADAADAAGRVIPPSTPRKKNAGGASPTKASPFKTPSKKGTPGGAKTPGSGKGVGVKSGRVTKDKKSGGDPVSPTKGRKNVASIKKEEPSSDAEDDQETSSVGSGDDEMI
ncbi:hypothetical protein DM02DRAFT_652041 [Periconia macrospinosa]|uniref:Uncharacterized protein n=1 Tax=Periconia macrospinosa TaxID=97972 RepID=A0A2V1E3K8_9PLEO|nr:hypothetical protein DM02DRAFT_652041 [Periconia macrospinosa]